MLRTIQNNSLDTLEHVEHNAASYVIGRVGLGLERAGFFDGILEPLKSETH